MFPDAPFRRRQRLRGASSGRQRAAADSFCRRNAPPPSAAGGQYELSLSLLKMMLMFVNRTGRAGELIQAKLKMLKDLPVADVTPSFFCPLTGSCWGLASVSVVGSLRGGRFETSPLLKPVDLRVCVGGGNIWSMLCFHFFKDNRSLTLHSLSTSFQRLLGGNQRGVLLLASTRALNSWRRNFNVLVESAIQGACDGGHVCQFCANQSHHTFDERKQKLFERGSSQPAGMTNWNKTQRVCSQLRLSLITSN